MTSIPRPSLGYRSPAEHVRVLGLLHEELHGPGPVGALSNLAQTEVTLGGTLGQASAHILYRRPRQRPTQQVRRSDREVWRWKPGGRQDGKSEKTADMECLPVLASNLSHLSKMIRSKWPSQDLNSELPDAGLTSDSAFEVPLGTCMSSAGVPSESRLCFWASFLPVCTLGSRK